MNRKANGIMGLRNHPHASASFPTVTFGNENKSTPYIQYYNQDRIKLKLKGLSPIDYRMRFASN